MPLAVHALALVMIPLFGVGILGVREIHRNDQAAAAATDIAESAAVQARAAALLVPLETERITMMAQLALAARGVDPADLAGLVGTSWIRLDDQGSAGLSAAFADLDLALAGESASLDWSAAVQQSIANERSRFDDGTATVSSVYRVFDEAFEFVDAVLARSKAALRGGDVGALDARGPVRKLDLVVDLVATAREGVSSFSAVVAGDAPPSTANMQVHRIHHLDALEDARLVDPGSIDRLASSYSAIPTIPASMIDAGPDLVAGPHLVQIATFGRLMGSNLDYLEQVSELAVDVSGSISEELDEWADEASRQNSATFIVFVLVGIASLAVGLMLMRSFTRPLMRLRVQAERIGRGELSAEPLHLEGPSDIQKVTAAVNDMASTLALVDDHMKALAAAENGEEPDLQYLPGRVGASMRTSMERVTTLTSRLQLSEARLAEEARIDALTGLPNRFAILEYVGECVRSDGTAGEQFRTGVMFLDIDGFKSVNDTHGHAVGDAVLREIARRLRASIRDVDVVARLGGDEFLIVVPGVSETENLVAFGRRMIEEIERPHTSGEQLFGVSASVGVTVIGPDDDSMSVVERADAAVYQAKRRGRRRVEMFDKELQRSIEHQAELELALRQAIQHDELRLHLQPIADLSTGEAVGAEALVRWERPGFGLVPPDEFIPIAERSGLIFEVERWVIGAACRRIASWQGTRRSNDFRLAVNISGRHLIEGELLVDLDDALAATGADPDLLEIELTESTLLDDVERASSVLAEVRARGIKVAIDDFGTGYSSMTYLQKLPVDVIKIDRSFIVNAAANQFDSTVVESVVTIARALALDVVAEGIETVDQLAYAMSIGVTTGQGFLLGRPMPPDAAERVMFGPPLFDVERVRREAGLGIVDNSSVSSGG